MTTVPGDEIVNDFYQRGTGELAVPHKSNAAQGTVPATKPHASAARPAVLRKPTSSGDAAGKQRKRTREQRLVLALARLLAARMR